MAQLLNSWHQVHYWLSAELTHQIEEGTSKMLIRVHRRSKEAQMHRHVGRNHDRQPFTDVFIFYD